ncbi:PQQ-binding-like beta-propeller repeat protein [Amnibacterium sp. CER49]|uniref:outer membrane protein assembly factor BamB family protein n=1 Tax=Amnibacterium sp. CER49 TaxID=3039161 RepID=UPI00244B3822|nr:PQQ-binding-like beta-propeller repeat protein [Amnibacterium sp. CER49]MDH2442397.1 PQQ-binding-like beta-propeller repeat protein [Amnibacterium sp. CER49]
MTASAVLACAVPLLLASPAGATTVDQWTASSGDSGNAATNAGETVITASRASQVHTAWTSTLRSATPYAPVVLGGVAYRVLTTGNTNDPSTFMATSAKTGAKLWTLALPGGADYIQGMTATSSKVLISFIGSTHPGGVLAVDTAHHSIAWRSALPASTIAGVDASYPERPCTDGLRVYVPGSSNVINAYRLTDGALLWKAPITFNSSGVQNRVDGLAVGNGFVFTSGEEGVIAYNSGTGKRSWRSAKGTWGAPVVAGGRLLASSVTGIEALPAAGCGTSTCNPLWSTSVSAADYTGATISAADASSVFLTYRTTRAGGPTACASGYIGHVARLSASTGHLQWTTSVGDFTTGLVHGGSTIWLFNEYLNSSCVYAERILAYSAAATTATPLARLDLPSSYGGYPQTLAIADGTLFGQTWAGGRLVAYRIPNT